MCKGRSHARATFVFFMVFRKKKNVLFCRFQKKPYLCSAFKERGYLQEVERLNVGLSKGASGCSTVGSILGLGPRGRTFESCHPD